jgi:hypothetical protein
MFEIGDKVEVGSLDKTYIGASYGNVIKKVIKDTFGKVVKCDTCNTNYFKGEIVECGKYKHYIILDYGTGKQYIIHNNYGEIKKI